jgi:NADH:ubiquinone oxidoreductase subunit K
LSVSLFIGGLFLICTNRKNLLLLVIGIELMLLGITLSYIISSIFFNLPEGQIYAFFILTIAAAESAIGLGMLIAAFRTKKSLSFTAFNSFKR